MPTVLTVRAVLLQALRTPGYGVELIDRVRRATGGSVRAGMGSIYPALRRLEKERLVRSSVVRPRRGAGRPRVYYELTLQGVAAHEAQRRVAAALFRLQRSSGVGASAALAGARLQRCADVSASSLRLRRSLRPAAR